ncbi:MAG: hypothetical protein EAX91_11015 [Candidatus Lokiarchaeota archaeon]|nr:hypothetical protein [Candidatus Lokiarchaeota archaeon]
MNRIQNQSKEVQFITPSHHDLLKELIEDVEKFLKGKRNVMYSDIINLIIREDYRGKRFNEIIVWCNYKIKQGKYDIMIE